MKTKVEGWIAKGGLSAIDLLSVKQAKVRYHMDIIDSLDDECEIEREEAAMEEHEIRIAHILVSLKSISSSSSTTSSKPAATIKIESSELDVL